MPQNFNRFDLETVYASIVSEIQKIIQICLDKGISDNLKYFPWDSRQEINELPQTDLIGLADWDYDENDHMPEIGFVILISVLNDKNLHREVKIMDVVRDRCVHPVRPEYLTWTIKDENLEPFSQFTITSFNVLPAGESEARTVRQIGIEMKRADYNK